MGKISRPLAGNFAGLLFTMIIQSAGATAGITVAMALSGTMSLEQAVPVNMGAAVAYTFMPLINHIILIPTLPLVLKLFNALLPPGETGEPRGAMYIDENLISRSVWLSLEMAGREIRRVADTVREMVTRMDKSFRRGESGQRERIALLDRKVDLSHEAIITFLAKLSQEELSGKQSLLCMNHIRIRNELELIGDVIDKNIMALIERKIEEKLVFSEEGFRELSHILGRIAKNFDMLTEAMPDASPQRGWSV